MFWIAYATSELSSRFASNNSVQEKYEYRTSAGRYLTLSPNENADSKKLLYRLKLSQDNYNSLKFFRSNTLDFVSIGFIKLRDGARIGLPLSYFSNSKKDIVDLLPDSFEHFQGMSISKEQIIQRLGQSHELDAFYESLLLSNEAKSFGLSQALAKSSGPFFSSLDVVFDVVCGVAAFSYGYVRSRKLQLNTTGRRLLYTRLFISAAALATLSRYLLYPMVQKDQDKQACELGLDCCEGSLEYFDKQIERNKLLRKVIDDGDKLIDTEGNYIRQPVYLPHTSIKFYMNYFGAKLTERRKLCEQHLNEMVKKMSQEVSTSNESFASEKKTEEQESKELEIFRRLRLKLAREDSKSEWKQMNLKTASRIT